MLILGDERLLGNRVFIVLKCYFVDYWLRRGKGVLIMRNSVDIILIRWLGLILLKMRYSIFSVFEVMFWGYSIISVVFLF